MAEENGRKRLQDLSKALQEKLSPAGEVLVTRRALKTVERLARDFTGESALPGLRVWRDAAGKFRLERPPRNAVITLEWQRDISAMVLITEKFGGPRSLTRYVYDQAEDHFRRMEGEGELHEDLHDALIEYLYPEAKK